MDQNQFVSQNIMHIRECVYETLRKGAEGADPLSLDRELSILAVRLEAMPREDVQPLVTLCDALRIRTNPASPQFITDPQKLQEWCNETRNRLIEEETHNDFLDGMRESAQDEIREAMDCYGKKMRELIKNYISQYGKDDFIRQITADFNN